MRTSTQECRGFVLHLDFVPGKVYITSLHRRTITSDRDYSPLRIRLTGYWATEVKIPLPHNCNYSALICARFQELYSVPCPPTVLHHLKLMSFALHLTSRPRVRLVYWLQLPPPKIRANALHESSKQLQHLNNPFPSSELLEKLLLSSSLQPLLFALWICAPLHIQTTRSLFPATFALRDCLVTLHCRIYLLVHFWPPSYILPRNRR